MAKNSKESNKERTNHNMINEYNIDVTFSSIKLDTSNIIEVDINNLKLDDLK
jgi:hypothetical protein